MSVSKQKDIGAYITTKYALAGTTVDSEVNGAWIDRQGFLSVCLALAILPVLADTETLTIVANWQDADDISGTGSADFGTALASTTLLASGTGTDVGLTLEQGSTATQFKQDLTAAKRFIRAQFTLTTSSSGTATYGAAYVLGGSDVNPVT